MSGATHVDASGLIDFELWSQGDWPRVDLVVEQEHIVQIRAVLPLMTSSSGVEFEAPAHLWPDPDDVDAGLVRVEVHGRCVGHLPLTLSSTYAPVLADLVARGLAPTTNCRIWASERDEWAGQDASGHATYERVLTASATVLLEAPDRIAPEHVVEQAQQQVVTPAPLAPAPEQVQLTAEPEPLPLPELESVPQPSQDWSWESEWRFAPSPQLEPQPEPDSLPEPGDSWTTKLVGPDFQLPEKPTVIFNPAPGWPPTPEGWEPLPGWTPLAEWPAPPQDWEFWVLR